MRLGGGGEVSPPMIHVEPCWCGEDVCFLYNYPAREDPADLLLLPELCVWCHGRRSQAGWCLP